MVNKGTIVEFWWDGTGADSYRLEIGSSSDASDVATFDIAAPTTSFSWTGVPIGNFYARVRGREGTTLGSASVDVLVNSIDARLMIDALVFGQGSLAPPGSSWSPAVGDQMAGWQPGTGFGLILGESVAGSTGSAVEATVQQIGPAIHGAVQVSVIRRPDPLPSPGTGEVTMSVIAAKDVNTQCECDNCTACSWIWYRGAFIQRGKVLVSSGAGLAIPARELGFMIGLGEIVSPTGVRPPFTMGTTTDGKYLPEGQLGVLDPATIRMLKALYGAGLTAGSTRRQFEAAGFVPPEGASATPHATSSQKPAAEVVKQDDGETLVIRHLFRERAAEY
jgi:hypothetical protein